MPDQITTLLELRNLPGDVLTVEVTEGVLMVGASQVLAATSVRGIT